MSVPEAARAFVGAFVDELARGGVRHVVVCPGSRSTPLAILLAEQADMTVWTHIDERSAGYFALGLAKVLRGPVALVCSSGTAAANFYPAIIEARYGRVPLLVLTADRPHELRDVGAPQAIDQIGLYGNHVKWFAELPVPEASTRLLRYIRTVAARALALSRSAPNGPVHLNFPFREPLMPALGEGAAEPGGTVRAGGRPYVRVAAPPPELPGDEVERLVGTIEGWRKGVIVCGPQDDPRLGDALRELSARLRYPLLVDPLSGLRCGAPPHENLIDAYDAFLRSPRIAAELAPRVVLRFGRTPTSKVLQQFLEQQTEAEQVSVDEAGLWNDPSQVIGSMLVADPVALCHALRERLPADLAYADGEWIERWAGVNATARAAIAQSLSQINEPFDGWVVTELAAGLPAGATLFAGNSMPIRDVDTFFPARQQPAQILANRGANGIDGVVSSSLGAAAGSEGPTVLLIGDLSFYHDLNGLLAAHLHKLDLTVILLNNDGGGIFSFLPQAEHRRHFEALFGTPHGLDFAPAVSLYGGRHCCVDSQAAFRLALQRSLDEPGLDVIEVRTHRDRNVALHRQIWGDVIRAVEA